MTLFSSWMPPILAFALPFVMVSLVSSFTYWLAHRPGVAMRWVKIASSVIASFLVLLGLTAVMVSVNPLLTLLCVLVVMGASALQAVLERAIGGNALTFKQQFVRSFFTFLPTIVISYLMAAVGLSMIAPSSLTGYLWAWNLAASGFLTALLIAPPSISFYRWMFQSLRLRPGMDRLLHEEELARPLRD